MDGKNLRENRKLNQKKMVVTAMLIGITVALSPLSIPVGTSRCFPVQHMMNVIIAVILGPGYGVSAAFVTSVIRNLLGMGTLLAFPGSMIGALLCRIVYKYTRNIWMTSAGEIVGTGVIGGIAAYPVAALLMGKQVAIFTFVVPFLVSTTGGCILGIILVKILEKTGVISYLSDSLLN